MRRPGKRPKNRPPDSKSIDPSFSIFPLPVTLLLGIISGYSAEHPGRADYTSGFLHSATLTGLSPSTKYFYTCGDKSLEMSSVRYFVTPPEIGQPSVTLGIVADLGQTEDSR